MIATRDRLVQDLRGLGVRSGSTLLVHCSLSSLGSVPGGEQTVALALRDVLGAAGNVVVPTQSWQLCDPSYLQLEPEASWETVRQSLPAYDPDWTPTRTMGLLADAIRTHPAAVRSSHPHRSFAAWGPNAEGLVANHELEDPVGEGSPLAALYAADAEILLLGVGYDKCTALHLAEARSGLPSARVSNGAPVLVQGQRRWIEFTEPVVDDSDFEAVGLAFANEMSHVVTGTVGEATARLMRMRALVDFARGWMRQHRAAS